jgi:hypothetical protein
VSGDGKTLYMDQAQARFFLVPDALVLPAGPFVLRTVLGERRDVDEAALAGYEITRAEADARVRARVAGLFASARAALDPLVPKTAAPATEKPIVTALRQLLDGVAEALAQPPPDKKP